MKNNYLKGIRSGWSRAPGMARIALKLGQNGASKLFGGSQRLDEQLGDTLLQELDELKGMAMKVGQILSYMDVGLPEEVTSRISQLQRGVTPLPAAVIIGCIEQELARPLSQLFSRFDEQAIAAASIGQVHRAWSLQGEPLAVKVRYPDIAGSFEGDFRKLAKLGALAGTFAAVDGVALVEELAARVREECDYRREAMWQQRFGDLFRDDDAIVVPQVYPALSGDGVLTSRFHEGLRFEDFCAQADDGARHRVAQALLRFAFRPLLLNGVLHADPHPGNQLFHHSGITALDYGCVRQFDLPLLNHIRDFYTSLLDDDRPGFGAAAIALGLAPKPDKLDFDELWRMYRWVSEPLWRDTFAFTRDWWLQGRAFTSATTKNARHQGMPPAWLWWQRVQWGLWALLVRLRAHGNFGSPFRAWLQADVAPQPWKANHA